MSRMTDWIDFPNGRARFSKGTRGWDERGYETFAVDLDGRVFYGEVDQNFTGTSMFIEISNFGYQQEGDVGIPGGAKAFTRAEARRVEALVRQLVVTVDGYPREDKVISMRTFGEAVLTGEIVFLDGWIEISDG